MEYTRLIVSLLLLHVIVAIGTLGYFYFEDMELFESLYMTLITISTVGFGEVKPLSYAGRVLTLFIIVSGISLLTYTLGQIATIVIEGELRNILGRRKVERKLTQLRDHFIICGYGRIGRTIARELREDDIPVVVIEQDEECVIELEETGYLYLASDATTEDALLKAGLMRARGLVTAVNSDANNVFISLTARGLNPDIFILARASEDYNADKLLRAGADRVVSPYLIGGKRMAEILLKPTVVDVLDQAMMKNDLGLLMEEVVVHDTSTLVGQSLIDSRLRQNFGIIVIAIKHVSGRMVFNPSADNIIEAGDVLVVIGKKDDLRRMIAVLS